MVGTARHALTILAVNDLRRAHEFYRSVFAWDVTVDVSVYVEFALPAGQRLGVYQREAFAHTVGHPPAAPTAGHNTGVELYLYVDDVSATRARVVPAGGQLLADAQRKPWGDEVAYVLDPDGNVLALARPLTASERVS